jgi:hypothetical protein
LPEQVVRLGTVVGFLVVVILVLRFVVIPRSVFSTELHQSSTVEREMARPIHFAGVATCRECHSDEYDRKSQGYHKNLACETCHGPSAKHAEDPMTVKPYAPRDRTFCPVCHGYDPSRPTGFPQINPMSHNPGVPCIGCHHPHDPVPPEVPHECSACHAQIARTKALSSHAQLPCTTCHGVDEKHKVQPRSALPTKPENREFCGQCHSTESVDTRATRAPRVDLTSHGGTYLCWQCHYPHLPEGR